MPWDVTERSALERPPVPINLLRLSDDSHVAVVVRTKQILAIREDTVGVQAEGGLCIVRYWASIMGSAGRGPGYSK